MSNYVHDDKQLNKL